jgi:dolichol-phosphate mannosyltransferase
MDELRRRRSLTLPLLALAIGAALLRAWIGLATGFRADVRVERGRLGKPAGGVDRGFDVSVVVPTRDEAENVGPLLAELGRVLAGRPAEAVFVDDSSNELTAAAVERAAVETEVEVRVERRREGERGDGLGGAVRRGLELARGESVAVMDADLQHPPALLPDLLAEAKQRQADVVIATRRAGEGTTKGLRPVRRLVSDASASLARLMFPRRLRGVSDPMSGFFVVRRGAVNPNVLRPHGFKVLLELLVRAWAASNRRGAV